MLRTCKTVEFRGKFDLNYKWTNIRNFATFFRSPSLSRFIATWNPTNVSSVRQLYSRWRLYTNNV